MSTPFQSTSSKKRAFTLIELLVVIAIIAILAAILFPVFSQARERARMTSCLSNAKQMGLGVTQYAQDYDEIIPVGGTNAQNRYSWMVQIYPYVKSTQIFNCPSVGDVRFSPVIADKRFNKTCYGWNWTLNYGPSTTQMGWNLSGLQSPSETIIIGDNGLNKSDIDNQDAFVIFPTDPRLVVADTNLVNSSGDNSGYLPKFRHQATKTVPIKYSGGTYNLPVDGRATFTFLDGHSKALTPGQAFEIVPNEPGSGTLGAPAGTPPGSGSPNASIHYKLWNRW